MYIYILLTETSITRPDGRPSVTGLNCSPLAYLLHVQQRTNIVMLGLSASSIARPDLLLHLEQLLDYRPVYIRRILMWVVFRLAVLRGFTASLFPLPSRLFPLPHIPPPPSHLASQPPISLPSPPLSPRPSIVGSCPPAFRHRVCRAPLPLPSPPPPHLPSMFLVPFCRAPWTQKKKLHINSAMATAACGCRDNSVSRWYVGVGTAHRQELTWVTNYADPISWPVSYLLLFSFFVSCFCFCFCFFCLLFFVIAFIFVFDFNFGVVFDNFPLRVCFRFCLHFCFRFP